MLDELASKRWKQEPKLSPAELLRMLRSRSGLTQAQLAQLLGFNSPRMVRNWEGEFYLPASDRLQRLIEIYLNRQVFVAGQEREEAELLWNIVKNWFETRKNKFETYPIFDERWFDASLKSVRHQLAVTTSTKELNEAIPLPLKTTAAYRNPARKHNLPAALNSFIGREQDVTRLLQLLTLKQPTRRLVTLTGIGGVGKTRLALEVAGALAKRHYYPNGVWLIELATIGNPTLVAQTMVVALGLEEKVGTIKEKAQLEALLVAYLQEKQLLLLVDNCEHLIQECTHLIENLLKNCPGLQVLVTSREILNLGAETQYSVAGLSLPKANPNIPNQSLSSADVMGRSEAIQLFIERATSRQLNFPQLLQSDEKMVRAVIQICQQLDGLPLAIELAAARVSVLSPIQIVEHLNDRFHLLTGGERTATPRQQTLAAAIEWSYNLLSPAEQTIFQSLAVFSAGWTIEAAEQVCLNKNSNFARQEVMDLVAQLANKSLVVVEVGGNYKDSTNPEWVAMLEPAQYRYCYLDTIQDYALKQLNSHQSKSDLDTLYEQHAQYYLQLATQAEVFFRTGQQKVWLKRLNLELDNLRAALEWCKQSELSNHPRIELGLRLGAMLWRYWNATGYYQEGLEHLKILDQRAQLAGLVNNPDYLLVQNAKAFLYRCQGDYLKSQELARQAVALAEILHDTKELALALYILGSIAARQGDYVEANTKYAQSLGLYRQFNDRRGIASLLYSISTAAFGQANYELAAKNGQECLQFYQELEDAEGLGQTYIMLGNLEYAKGSYLAARAYYLESLEMLGKAGQKRLLAYAFNNLGIIAALLGEYELVSNYFNECVALARELGDKQGELYGLINSAEMSLLQKDFTNARVSAEEARLLATQMGEKNFLAQSLEFLGWLKLEANEYPKAHLIFLEALQLRAELGNRSECNKLLTGFSKLAWQANKLKQAATLAGFVATSLEASVQPLKRYEQEIFDKIITEGRTRLGSTEFEEAFDSTGKQMSLDQILNYILEQL